MTRAHELTHRPDCPQSGTHESRIGSWTLTRCDDCRATGIRKTDPKENAQ